MVEFDSLVAPLVREYLLEVERSYLLNVFERYQATIAAAALAVDG